MNVKNANAVSTDFKSSDSMTSGIQEAVDALPDSGGTVLIPTGTHKIHHRITLKPNIRVTGEGPSTVITRTPIFSTPLIKSFKVRSDKAFPADVSRLKVGHEVCIRSEDVYGWNSCHAMVRKINSASVEIEPYPWNRCNTDYLLKHNAALYNWFPCFWMNESENITVKNLCIDGKLKRHPFYRTDFVTAAVHTRNCRNVRVENLSIRNWPSDGVGIQGGSNSIIRGCIVENCRGHGFHPGTGTENSVWTNNIAKNNTRDGFFFCMNVRNSVCSNNIFQNNRANGIGGLGDPDKYNVVSNNVCVCNGLHGIEAGRSIGNVIEGNLCKNNSQLEPGKCFAILLTDHKGNTVTGNQCCDDQETPTQTRGIVSLRPGPNNFISGNHEFLMQ